MERKTKFGLVLPKAEKLRTKASAIFDNSSDEETQVKKKYTKIPQSKPLSKGIKAEVVEDPSIYEYDSIYDDMKAKQIEEKLPKEKTKSRYIETLLKAADKRKKQYERRVEKKIQVEREKEGDKFKDKEEFVTSSYKKKMQEMEEEEEREHRENLMNEMMDVTKQKDLSGFYRHFLKQAIGEEKIPTLGDRQDVKAEPLSDTENDPTHSKPCKKSVELQNNLKSKDPLCYDSDSVSSDKSEHAEDQNEKEKCKLKRKQRHDSVSNSENEDSSEKSQSHSVFHERHKLSRGSKCTSGSSNLSDDGSNLSEINTTDKLSNHDDSKPANELEKSSSNDKESRQKNIFAKRTVGSIFDEAQARYFMRLASRNA